MSVKNRVEWMDVFRGTGIILMIMGHIGFGDYFDIFIHAFHMPMFFFISGFFFKHKEKYEAAPLEFIKKKAKALLIPYLVFGIVFYIVEIFLEGFSWDPLYHLLWINTGGLPIAGALWFLTALFITEVVYFLIDRYIEKELIKWMIVIVLAVLGNVAGIILPFTLPYATAAALVGVGLFHLGYQIHKYENSQFVYRIMNLKWYMCLLCVLPAVMLIFLNGYVNMRSGEYAIIPLFWLNAIVCILLGTNISKYLCSILKGNTVQKWLSGIGKDSIIYVCLNQFVLLIINRYFFISATGSLGKLAMKLSTLLTILIVFYGCTKAIVNTKLRCLIGR